jgi:hypothetical protein
MDQLVEILVEILALACFDDSATAYSLALACEWLRNPFASRRHPLRIVPIISIRSYVRGLASCFGENQALVRV